MRIRLVELDVDPDRDVRPTMGNKALKLIASRCDNIVIPKEDGNDPFYQGLINLLEQDTDGFRDLSLNVPFVKFLYNLNNNFTFIRPVKFEDLFETVDNMNTFNNNILPTLKDIEIFKPYSNCYNKPVRECAYLCRVIDSWFGAEFEHYFGNVLAKDTGVEALKDEDEKLEQSDFGYLFTTDHLEQATKLISSGLPNSNRLDTVYGMIEHLTDLNEAKIRGNIRKNKRSTASEDEVRDLLKNIQSHGEPLEDKVADQIITGLKFR